MSAPIVPENYHYGVNVVDIGDLRVARGKARRERSMCAHMHLVYDDAERRIWCEDCETDIEAFDVFKLLVERHDQLKHKALRLQELEKETLISRAAKKMDEAFRMRSMAPTCPHCKEAILPEDVLSGWGLTGKEMARARRNKK